MDRILVIGASSGGPPVLFRLIPRFPRSFPYPIVIVQHMPPGFTGTMAELLDENAALAVQEARQGLPVVPGTVLVAPSPYHLYLSGGGDEVICSLRSDPEDSVCSPRIDCALETAAELYGKGALAVVLTGMSAGQDCIKGAEAVRAAGGTVLTQDEESCACHGMPGGVEKAGHSSLVAPLPQLYEMIIEAMGLTSP